MIEVKAHTKRVRRSVTLAETPFLESFRGRTRIRLCLRHPGCTRHPAPDRSAAAPDRLSGTNGFSLYHSIGKLCRQLLPHHKCEICREVCLCNCKRIGDIGLNCLTSALFERAINSTPRKRCQVLLWRRWHEIALFLLHPSQQS